MSDCCDAATNGRATTWARSVREIVAWVLPSAILVLVPKCPACLAAHVTLWTGLGLSFSTATYLRWLLLLLCIASLLFLVVNRLSACHVTQWKGEHHEHETRIRDNG
jgi:hypothetical protein